MDFARGPLFRLTFAIMVLGLLRLVFLTIYGAVKANLRAGDKTLRWKYIIRYTLHWLFPVKKLWIHRPVYSTISVLFHIGLILVPIFYFGHIQLWEKSLGFGWPNLGRGIADILTITTIVTAVLLFLMRVFYRPSRFLSRPQDYCWTLLLAIPFLTGYLSVNSGLSPSGYQFTMLVHFLSADMIFLMIPFTKVAHCVLIPFSQLISAQGWRFPAGYGDKVVATLGREELGI